MMNDPLPPDVMIRQVGGLAHDLRTLTPVFARQVHDVLSLSECALVNKVYLVGNGDSYHASCATEMAFEAIAGVSCEPLCGERFFDYGAPWMYESMPGTALVIAISRSGRTPCILRSIERARDHGALSIALSGTHGSPATDIADRAVVVSLPCNERSPGIRTYQASMIGLLLVAIRLAEARGMCSERDAGLLRSELVLLGDMVDATNGAISEQCRGVAEMIADASSMMMLGSGPSYGTALYGAAKIVEGSGVFAVGQDLEEWWHVERFAYPLNMPVFIIAPPGRSHWRAVEQAKAASDLGRRVIAVAHNADTDVRRHTLAMLPVHGEVREEFSPLLYHLFASHVSSAIAERLGRLPFQGNR